jgi:hypothetical protein
MKIRELLELKERYLPGGARSVAADRTQTTVNPGGSRNRIVRREPLWSQDVFSDAEPSDGVTGDLSVAPDPPLTSLAPISTPHTRDLDFIKAQIARLPRQTEQTEQYPNAYLQR